MRAAREGVTTALMGAVLGYVIAMFAGPLWNENAYFGTTTESPQARAFMVGLLKEDPDALIALRPNRDVASRALEMKNSQSSQGQSVPVSLTYLGGGSQGRLQVHIYAVELQVAGQPQYFPLALTLFNGKVVRTE
jgi:hypothetical protein